MVFQFYVFPHVIRTNWIFQDKKYKLRQTYNDYIPFSGTSVRFYYSNSISSPTWSVVNGNTAAISFLVFFLICLLFLLNSAIMKYETGIKIEIAMTHFRVEWNVRKLGKQVKIDNEQYKFSHHQKTSPFIDKIIFRSIDCLRQTYLCQRNRNILRKHALVRSNTTAIWLVGL